MDWTLPCRPEAAFILAIAACKVHQEKPDPSDRSISVEAQRWGWLAAASEEDRK